MLRFKFYRVVLNSSYRTRLYRRLFWVAGTD